MSEKRNEFNISNIIFLQKKNIVYFFFGPVVNGWPISLPRNLTPKALSNLLKTCWFGIALDCSYSLITCCFSLIFLAKSACVHSLATRAVWIARATSFSTLSWCNSSVSRSKTAVFFAASCCLLCPPANFFEVSIATPARSAAAIADSLFNSPGRGARLPV
jgi:hypothetical protein